MRRFMRANERTTAPSCLIAFDTETIPETAPRHLGRQLQRLRLGAAVYWRREHGRTTREQWLDFTEPGQLWEWVRARLQARKRTYLFAHNAGFDLTAARFWREMEEGRFRLYRRPKRPGRAGLGQGEPQDDYGSVILEDPPTVVDVTDGRGYRLTVVDMLNWLPMKLAKIGEWVNVPKAPMPGDEASDDDWAEYCRLDVRVLAAAVNRVCNFVLDNDLGNWRYTAAGQSLALYRHRCMNERILLGHEEELKSLERAALYGARSRAYFIGRVIKPGTTPFQYSAHSCASTALLEAGAVFRLDGNAHYPAAMTAGPYPVQYLYSCSNVSPAELVRQLEVQEGVAEVIIDSRTEPYPVRTDENVRWCVGRFKTTLAGPELKRALASSHVVSVPLAQLYKRGYPFQRFSPVVIEGRRKAAAEDDELAAFLWKTIGVSLWGKFCQRAQKWVTNDAVIASRAWGHYPRRDEATGALLSCRAVAWVEQIAAAKAESWGNFPLIGAYVTAYGREVMRAWRFMAGEGETLYEDADSLHVTAGGLARLVRAGQISYTRPGLLKPEEIALEAEYRGPKHYRLGSKWTVAGVGSRATRDERGLLHETRFYGLKVTLNGEPPEGPLTEEVTYETPVPKLDGRLSPSGWLDWPVYA